ncbi:hypothetical protein LSG23_09565 [Bacillus velezensis]|uniref:hypothetical protein n=1 Tax=Bacillus velezensis TaxID=492670 RepID=UPI000987E8DE|nr:hypothetical protein [Bacillus velezensis]AQS44225.1 hypothetical protein BVH55_10015 [Bacillus velezensis]WNR79392.1 hypothetical protein RP314_10765 [Bacillus velezensis]
MYGEDVEVTLDGNIKVKVFVFCLPTTCKKEKEKRALLTLKNLIDKRLKNEDLKYLDVQSDFVLIPKMIENGEF